MLFIGKDVQERMNLLGLNAEKVANTTFLENSYIQEIIDDEIALNDIDEFDFALICSVLHCNSEFFTNKAYKQKDLLVQAMKCGKNNKKSIEVMAKIQDFINDFSFTNEALFEDRLEYN